jgi:hypothetical protein
MSTTGPDDVDERIARLREATHAIAPGPAFTERVLGAVSVMPPRHWLSLPHRAWWGMPIAAALAAAALLWAASVHARQAHIEAARDVELALGAGQPVW